MSGAAPGGWPFEAGRGGEGALPGVGDRVDKSFRRYGRQAGELG